MNVLQESRVSKRCIVNAHVEVNMDSGVMLDGDTADISLRGMRFYTDRSLPVGMPVRVRILFGDDDFGDCLAIHARVARVEEGGVAVEFTGIDAEHTEHLHRLVRQDRTEFDPMADEVVTPTDSPWRD